MSVIQKTILILKHSSYWALSCYFCLHDTTFPTGSMKYLNIKIYISH